MFGFQHISDNMLFGWFLLFMKTLPDSDDHHHVAHDPSQQDGGLEHGAYDPIQGIVVLWVRALMSSGKRANYPIISLSWTKHLKFVFFILYNDWHIGTRTWISLNYSLSVVMCISCSQGIMAATFEPDEHWLLGTFFIITDHLTEKFL